MGIDLGRFATMRTNLERERSIIRTRLAELDDVLGGPGSNKQPASVATQIAAPARAKLTRRPSPAARGSRSGKMTMRDVITAATERGPIGINDLVPAVKKLGYKFTSKNPVNSLGAYLYGPSGKAHFRKVAEGFIPR